MSGGFPELLASSAIASAMRLYSVVPRRECGDPGRWLSRRGQGGERDVLPTMPSRMISS